MRLAHYSDIHVTVTPWREGVQHLLGKRFSGALSFSIGGRGRHFEGSDHRIRRLLDDVDRQGVDHALCTGDVTQTSLEVEFRRCAELFGERLQAPERHTVIPGNHDRYTRTAEAERRFERFLGELAGPGGRYPFTKQIGEGVRLVAIDVSRSTSLADSSGLCGAAQRDELQAILTDASLRDEYVILAMHYGLLRRTGRRDRRTHRVRDDLELIALLDRGDVHLDLVLHGHMHRPYRVRTARRTVICTGSATDLAGRCGYNVLDIDVDNRRLEIERRVWDADADGYVPARSDEE